MPSAFADEKFILVEFNRQGLRSYPKMQSGDNPIGSNLFRSGQTLSKRFEIIEEVGRGGMAVVYKSMDLRLQREVAIKVLNAELAADPIQLERFRNEANACSSLEHPNIVTVMHCGQEQGRPYMVMEWLDGRTLEQVLEVEKKLSCQRFRQIFLPVLDALEYAHEKKFVHRDLKPANIMVCEQNSEIMVKVLDFGIAKKLDGMALTAATIGFIGSPYYMSPEQLSGGKVSFSSDIYSLACVMFQALTGRLPFAGNNALESMYEHLRLSKPKMHRSEVSPDISSAVIQCVLEALRQDPAKRIGSAADFKSRLVSALDSKTKGRSILPIALGAGVLVACAGVCWVWQEMNTTKLTTPSQIKSDLHHSLSGLSPQVALDESKRLTSEGKYGEAVLRLRKALQAIHKKDDPNIVDLKLSLAGLYKINGDKELAKRTYLELINFYDNEISAVKLNSVQGLASELISEKKYSEAEEICAKYAQQAESAGASIPNEYLANVYSEAANAAYFQHKNATVTLNLAKKAIDYYGDSGRTLQCGVATTWFYYDRCCDLGHKERGLAEVARTRIDLEKYARAGDTTVLFAKEAERRKLLDIARQAYGDLHDKSNYPAENRHENWPLRGLAELARIDKEIAKASKINANPQPLP